MSTTQGGAATARETPKSAPAESAEQRLAAETLDPPTPGASSHELMEKVSVNATSGPTDQEIARRAYELYLARGGEHGFDMDDWIQAESELRDRTR